MMIGYAIVLGMFLGRIDGANSGGELIRKSNASYRRIPISDFVIRRIRKC